MNSKQWFLIDAIGAGVSAIMLGVVLVRFQIYFGIPTQMLYLLALIPLLFIIYDTYAYLQDTSRHKRLLQGIATLNFLYCLLSMGLAIQHREVLTTLGWVYIIGEVMIIIVIGCYELKTANRL